MPLQICQSLFVVNLEIVTRHRVRLAIRACATNEFVAHRIRLDQLVALVADDDRLLAVLAARDRNCEFVRRCGLVVLD